MMKKIQFILAVVAASLLAPGLQAQVSPFVLSKDKADNGNGDYTLTLKTYMTGNYYDANSGPADIVFLMDVSKDLTAKITDENLFVPVSKPVNAVPATITTTVKAAMTVTTKNKATATANNPTKVTKAMTATTRVTKKTQNWTYKNLTANATGTENYCYFYRDENGIYYEMRKWSGLPNSSSGSNNVYAIGYVDNSGNTWYLTTDGVSSTYKDITSTTTTQWNGTLYKGWTYDTHSSTGSDGSTSYQCYGFTNCNETATIYNQWYYLHEGQYYPVRRAKDLPDSNGGNTARAAWIIIDGVRWYLNGEQLSTDYDHDMMSDYRSFWFGDPCYRNCGWRYKDIISATASGGHYFKFTDDNYYPVQKEDLGSAAGSERYQAFIMVSGVKWYLYGTNKLSRTPCPFSSADNIYFYFGDLYKGGWCTNNITDGSTATSHYYLHTDGEYYPVREIAETNNYQAYVILSDGRKYYFNGNALSETPDIPYSFSTTKYVTLYFGSLYTMTGWSYAGVTDATAGAGHYYKHTNEYYYPVRKEDLGAGLDGRYQLYVDVPEGKRYLWGHSLHDEPCPYSAGTATVIWYGSLYKGGWSYSTITVNTSDKQGYSYLHTDGEYYPIFQETVTISGATTYQDYVILPDGNKWYLCGNEVSRNPYPYTLKNTVNNWFGELYSSGWTYANVTVGTAASGHQYLHTDGNYYPVLKEDNSSGSTRYQLYVNVPEGKRYLYGTGISESKYPFSARTNVGIFYGTLYTGGWTYNNITAGSATAGQFYLYGDKYYRLVKEKISSSSWQVYIGKTLEEEDFPLGKTYLAGSGISSSPYPYSSVEKASLYFPSLYQLKANVKSIGLQNAVNSFIDEMARISQQAGINHRVALAQFGYGAWGDTGGKTAITYPHLKCSTSVYANQRAMVLADFYDLSTSTGVSNIKTGVNQTIESSGNSVSTTSHKFGFSLAEGLFRREGGADESGTTAGYNYDGTTGTTINNYEKSVLYGQKHVTDDQKAAYALRRKIVIVIGDGVERTFNTANNDSAIEWANRLKALTPLGDSSPSAPYDKVTIYYVQVNPGTSTNPAYADVTAFNKALATDDDHFYHVEKYDEALENALLDIAEEIGGSVVPVGTDAIVQDVVPKEFTVPTNAQIQLFTANCIGDGDFAGEEAFNGGTIVRTDNLDGTTTIRVTGFDFSANWCGVEGSSDDLYYRGKQLIVKIPIHLKTDLVVGGVIPTNTSDSKLLDANQQTLEVYPIPTIEGILVHLQISKSGLQPGESAIFTVWQKDRGAASFVTTGTPVARVILTGKTDGTPAVADLVGLDPAKVYLIRDETGWSWTYTPNVSSISTEDQTMNPFEFTNTVNANLEYESGEGEVQRVF